MPLIEYRCKKSNRAEYVFSGEESARLTKNKHGWRRMHPNPTIIHTTDTWMSEASLDSFNTVYELDRQLNIEVSEEKEMSAFNAARKML